MLGYISLVALGLLACAVVTGALVKRERIRNLEAAWSHRERFAEILGQLEKNPDTPDQVLIGLRTLADGIFDERFLKKIDRKPVQKDRSRRSAKQRRNARLQKMKKQYGPEIGPLVHEAMTEYAWVVMYAQLHLGFRIRHHRWKSKGEEKSVRRQEATNVYERFIAPANDNAGPHTNGPAAAANA